MSEAEYIPKSYQFERDMDSNENSRERVDSIEFGKDSNDHFVHDDMVELIETVEGNELLSKMLDVFFNSQKVRLDILDDYSKGNNTTILSGTRRLDKNKSDKRIRHPYGGYISGFVAGFIAGNPITVSSNLKQSDDLEDLAETHTTNDIDTLNYDLVFDAGRYGRAFELHMRHDDDGVDRIYLIDPQEMFVVRTTDVTKSIIGAVHCPIYNDQLHLTIYTDDKIYTFEPSDIQSYAFVLENEQVHFYDIVPVVEWWGNRYRTGDFEPVLSIIDAYDSAQSDTANYMNDLNDAVLAISGNIKGSGYSVSDFIEMKDANFLLLESAINADGSESRVTAQYLYKQYDVQGSEANKTRLDNDIFKLSNIPNLENESFGTASGIAIQYKLVGLRQLQSTKESYFGKALRRRYDLIENIHQNLNDVEIESSELEFTFHPNLPENIWDEVKAYVESGGELSQETLMDLTSFTNSEEEKTRLLDEYNALVLGNKPIPRLDPVEEEAEDVEEVIADGEE